EGVPDEYVGNLTAVEGNCNTFISNMSKYNFKDIIINKSNAYKIDAYVTAAIIAIESEGNPYCGNTYHGLMQVEGGSSDSATNIEQGLKEYKQKMSAVGIQPHVIFSAYNSGEGTVLNSCKQNGYNTSTVTVKQLGDALYSYVKANNSDWDPNEKKYYASKVLKAYNILKTKNALK
ncbi:hypothetical protein FDF91_17015, partial [Clostridium botulinum]|nr:hypothetical protein [Clostridium botulinum]